MGLSWREVAASLGVAGAISGCDGSISLGSTAAGGPMMGESLDAPSALDASSDSTTSQDDGGEDALLQLDAAPETIADDAGDSATAPVDGPEDVLLQVDAGPLPPSCAPGGPGMTNCGGGNESCCTSLEVPGGTFFRSYNYPNYPSGPGPANQSYPATVSGFRLDKYLVTVGRFRQFVAAWKVGYTPPPGSGKHVHLNGGLGLVNAGDDAGISYEPGWVASDDVNVAPTDANLLTTDYAGRGTWTSSPGTQENLPINVVDWHEAYAFCIWDGGFLPSEAEYEYAAAGGSEDRLFPWGITDPGLDNQYAIYDCLYPTGLPSDLCHGDGGPGSLVAPIAPVGTPLLGAGRWGQLDLVGEVGEWMLDWAPQNTLFIDPCVDCGDFTPPFPDAGPAGGPFKWYRGGSFNGSVQYEGFEFIEVGSGDGYIVPYQRTDQVGFRCARTP
jgi:formylglycine-generating enzyme required for sulfatase activity